MQYQIKQGDTLGAIAAQFGRTVEELARINKIANPNKIRAGASLAIPEEGPAAASPPPAPPPPPPVEEIGRIEPYGYEAPPPEPIDVEIVPEAELVSHKFTMPSAQVVEKPEPGAYDVLGKVLDQARLYTDPVRVLSGNAGDPNFKPGFADYLSTALMGLATPHGRVGPPIVQNEAAMMKYSEMLNRSPASMPGSMDRVITSMERPVYKHQIGMQQPTPVAPTPNFAPRMSPIGDPLAGNMGRLPLSVRAKEFALPREIVASRDYSPVANAFINAIPWSPVR
jgi:LysM repeat protein